jgi:hypothetical protein
MQKALALLSVKFMAHRDALGHGVFLAPIQRIRFSRKQQIPSNLID